MAQDQTAPSQTPKPRSKLGFFWKTLIIVCVSLVLLVLIFALQAYRIKSWVENGVESSPAALPAPSLSEDERRGIEDLYRNYEEHYAEKKDLDVLLTAEQFNHMVAENIAKQKARGNRTEMEALQIAFEGPQTVFRGTAPVPDRPGLYFNFEFRGTFSIENGKAAWNVENIRLHGQDGPVGTQAIMQELLRKAFAEQEARRARGADSIFRRVKLLRREGDQIHAILNGEYLEPPTK
jgi:hypothetical protein